MPPFSRADRNATVGAATEPGKLIGVWCLDRLQGIVDADGQSSLKECLSRWLPNHMAPHRPRGSVQITVS